jgi:hypothetical protein
VTAPTTVPHRTCPKRAMTALLALGTVKMMFVTATQARPGRQRLHQRRQRERGGRHQLQRRRDHPDQRVVNVDTPDEHDHARRRRHHHCGLSVSARWGYIYVDTGTPSTSPILGHTDFSQGAGGNVTVTGYQFDAAGILAYVVA